MFRTVRTRSAFAGAARDGSALHRAWPALLFGVLATACADGPAGTGRADRVDLDRLFAPPTAAERSAVQADWAQRAPAARDVRVELTQALPLPGAAVQVHIVSHVFDGNRHYGAILAPAQAPATPLPLIAYLHGGDGGVAVEELLLLFGAIGFGPADAVWVVPSFRAEPLRLGAATWRSGGEPSPWDRDVDDALALIDVALALSPAADAARIGALGLSRGAGVALLMTARDPRIRATVEFFGPTDFFGPFVRTIAQQALAGRPPALPGVAYLNSAWLQRLRLGQVTYEDTRLALLRRSPAHFAERLGPVQLHHGTADTVVPVSQAHHLIDAMTRIGRGPPDFEAFLYPALDHNPFVMTGAADRVAAFLGRLRG